MNSISRSRRDFLRLSGVATGVICLGGLLQACGGGSAAASPAASSAKPSAASSQVSAAASTPASAKPASSAPAPASSKPAGSAPAASPASASAKAGSKASLIVSYGSPAGSFAPLWITKEIGAWDKHGVSVDLRLIETNTAVAAVIGKSVAVMSASAAPVITADVNGNEDLVFIGSALNHPILGLYTVPSITSAEQLKGKVVASGKPGSPVDYSARLALSLLKLKPSDVSLRPVGTSAQITAALFSGQVPSGMEAPPQSFQVEAKGFHLLQGIFKQPYQNVGLIAKRSRLEELADAMPPLLEGLREGILAWNKEPDVAKKVLTKYAKVTDPTVLQKTYDFYTKTAPFEPSLQPTMEGIQAMMDFLSAEVPAIKKAKAEQFVDLRFLSKLPKA